MTRNATNKLTVGSLFAGIGGFDLGLERAGFEIKFQVEIDPFCRAVLAKHWPDVRRYEDVRTVGAHNLESVDVLCGGFPCQDVSQAGARAGIDGERSGLWREFARLVGELQPRYVLVENVPGLLVRGMGRVLGELAALGYDAEWQSIPAAAVGAPHIRDRVWILAYPGRELRTSARGQCAPATGGGARRRSDGRRGGGVDRQEPDGSAGEDSPVLPDTESRFARQLRGERRQENRETQWHLHWAEIKSPVPRVVDGVPDRVDRNTALGNAIVPQISEWIGRRILEVDLAS